MRSGHALLVVFCVSLLFPAYATAQPDEKYWGVQASFAPKWEVKDSFRPLFDADVVSISGSEFRIGFARGRTLGGEWGVSYVRKLVKDGSFALQSPDFEPSDRTTQGVTVSGVSIDKFSPSGTIKDRVQIGLTYGIGVGQAKGTVTERDIQSGDSRIIEAKQFFSPFGQEVKVVPLAELQLAVAVIAGPGFKMRASGGLNYPGTTTFTITGVYMFGAK